MLSSVGGGGGFGGSPPESQLPSQKNTQNTRRIHQIDPSTQIYGSSEPVAYRGGAIIIKFIAYVFLHRAPKCIGALYTFWTPTTQKNVY